MIASPESVLTNDVAADALTRIALLSWPDPSASDLMEDVAEAFGAFVGLPPRITLLDDGRSAALLDPVSYRQQSGVDWPVPAGALTDGASISRLFWTLIGGPFEGRYRNAAIVHDRYCVTRGRPWRDVHRMFYEAMRCGGVTAAKAKLLYYAVFRFGPRWAARDGADEAVWAAAAAGIGTADMPSLLADAQAIFQHDPDLEEIEALADARDAAPPTQEGVAENMSPATLARARLLVIPGGSGGPDDVEAVAREAALLPDFVMRCFERQAIRIVACHHSVTDVERDLAGVTPRGWDGTGKSWDDVPGTYFDDRKRVVIATIAASGRRVVPTSASGLHGSANLVVHESLHGYDYARKHRPLGDRQFLSARESDLANLGSYERQKGRAGLEESFAESGARFVADSTAMARSWSHLFGWWASSPDSLETAEPMIAATVPADDVPEPDDSSIGTARMADDGVILVDLRAEGPGGAIGHAAFRVAPDAPEYAALREHLFGSTEAVNSMDSTVPFRPMPSR